MTGGIGANLVTQGSIHKAVRDYDSLLLNEISQAFLPIMCVHQTGKTWPIGGVCAFTYKRYVQSGEMVLKNLASSCLQRVGDLWLVISRPRAFIFSMRLLSSSCYLAKVFFVRPDMQDDRGRFVESRSQ